MAANDATRGKDRERTSPGFKVTDRRHFTPEGEVRSPGASEPEEPDTPPPPPPPTPEGGVSGEERTGFERRPLDEPEGVDFTMLINAMAQPALLFLGEIPHPATGQPAIDPEKAKLQIDMLELLRVKCRGNLPSDEEHLLEQVLYQLRMLYVARVGPAR